MEFLKPTERSEKLSLYLDGALPDSERTEVERTLAEHPDARRELEELRRLRTLLAQRTPVAPDASFWPRLADRIANVRTEETNLLPFRSKVSRGYRKSLLSDSLDNASFISPSKTILPRFTSTARRVSAGSIVKS